MKRLHSQKGFGLVGIAVLGIAVAVIIGTVVWYVWSAQADKPNADTPPQVTKTANIPQIKDGYVVVREWDAKMKLDPVFGDISYTRFTSYGVDEIQLLSPKEKFIPEGCTVSTSHTNVSIQRFAPENYGPAAPHSRSVKHLGNYYYVYTSNLTGCEADTAGVEDMLNAGYAALWNTFSVN